MYIQSYHIHNVLNEYRKRLSASPAGSKRPAKSKSVVADSVHLSQAGQRQAIIDQVSADIVERMIQSGPQSKYDKGVSNYRGDHQDDKMSRKGTRASEFVYTTIDENNRKSMQTFPVNDFRPSMGPSGGDGNAGASADISPEGS